MPEELSPESKLYVKEEIEKVRKEFKEELKDAQSKSTKIFSIVALIVGLLASMGVYGLAKSYINTSIAAILTEDTVTKIEEDIRKLSGLRTELEKNQVTDPNNGYLWIGNIALIWGTHKSTTDDDETFPIGWGHFPNDCFTVLTSLAGKVEILDDNKNFKFNRISGYQGELEFTFLAIGY